MNSIAELINLNKIFNGDYKSNDVFGKYIIKQNYLVEIAIFNLIDFQLLRRSGQLCLQKRSSSLLETEFWF